MKAKLIALGIMALVGLIGFVIWKIETDRQVVFEVEKSPEQLVADGKDVMTIRFTIRNPDGTPRKGDNVLVIKTKGHGSTKVTRVKTDENGQASFDYYSYKESSFKPAEMNQIQLSDVSVGKIIGVYKRHWIDIPVESPREGTESGGESGETGGGGSSDDHEEGEDGGYVQFN